MDRDRGGVITTEGDSFFSVKYIIMHVSGLDDYNDINATAGCSVRGPLF